MRSVSRIGVGVHFVFSALVVLNLVGGFLSLGTLLAVGLMILPAVAARFWSDRILPLCVLAILTDMAASACGLLISYYFALPSGPAIILVAGGFYLVSLMVGPRGGVLHSYTIQRRAL